ncbi:mitotic interactor and substrate of PLK1 isoform X2 [Choloepus didactylus]|nr:mitotic interactor and substrate of PLK1 isoform X2 [Choloepus didactylus]XP_037679944.1 mitotic interactor and substrate of PLK1 isoform X2 [Choloepus didactylus]
MDRVTRYPIFSIPYSPRVAGLALDGDTSYTIKLVGVGPEEPGWGRAEPPAWPEALLDTARPGPPSPRWPRSDDAEEDMEADHLDTALAFPRRPWDLEQERWVLRRGKTVARLQGTLDLPDGAPSQPRSSSPEESAVDTGQINFLAARQQFLSLEQANAGTPGKGPGRVAPGWTPLTVNQDPRASARLCRANGHTVPEQPPTRDEKRVQGRGSPEPPAETPIEREIRLAQEREAALRAQRGLQQVPGPQELVQVPTRPLLARGSLSEASRPERGGLSLYVQRDVAQWTQREQDHRQEGLRLGRPSTPDAPPGGPRRTLSSDALLGPEAPAPEARKVRRIPPDAYLPYLNPGGPPLEFPAFGVHGKPGGQSADEARAAASAKATGSRRPVSEPSGKPLEAPRGSQEPLGGPQRANGGVVRREYFCLRPLCFRVPDEPRKAEAPQVRGWEVAGTPGRQLQKTPSSELLEREVESVLRREREVAEERRSVLFPEVFPDAAEGGGRTSRSSSAASGITGSYSVSESPSFSPVRLHSDLVWTVAAEPEAPGSPPGDGPWHQKRKDLQYAGLDPLDFVNLEVLEATRVTRHRSALAERWEAGIYGSEDED